MNRRIVSFTSASIILFLAAFLCKPTVEVALGSPTPTIFVVPPTSTAAVGQTFVIDIKISDVSHLYGWEFKLGWNPSILDATKVSEGSFLKQGGSTFFANKTDNTEGYILADCTLLGDVPGVNGSGTLATVEFYAENQGESVLDLHDTILINSDEAAIPHMTDNGTVTITGAPVGGVRIPVDKLRLLAPYIKLVMLLAVAVATVSFFKYKKKPRGSL